jgi:hypothetical protein
MRPAWATKPNQTKTNENKTKQKIMKTTVLLLDAFIDIKPEEMPESDCHGSQDRADLRGSRKRPCEKKTKGFYSPDIPPLWF